MRQSADFFAITEKACAEAPIALQMYVRAYFKRKTIFGVECWVAFRDLGRPSGMSAQGVAPSHMLDVNRFIEGLPRGVELYEVIRKLEKNGERTFHFSAIWDDGCIGPPIRDD